MKPTRTHVRDLSKAHVSPDRSADDSFQSAAGSASGSDDRPGIEHLKPEEPESYYILKYNIDII